MLDSPDVDIRIWNATVAEMETSGKLRDALSDSFVRTATSTDVRAWLTSYLFHV